MERGWQPDLLHKYALERAASPIGDIAVPTFGPAGPSIDVLPDGRMIVAAASAATNELWAIDNLVR